MAGIVRSNREKGPSIVANDTTGDVGARTREWLMNIAFGSGDVYLDIE